MTRRLVLSYLAITLFALAVLEIPLGLTFSSREAGRLLAGVERDARVLATYFEDHLERGTGDLPVAVADDYTARTDGRVVVVDAEGTSVVDTEKSFDVGRGFSTRPEFATALDGRTASGTRRSETLDQEMLFVAVPVGSGGRVYGAVRVSYPRSELDERVMQNWARLGLLAVVVIGAVLLVGWVLARSVTRPVRALQLASGRVADGDLTARVEPAGPPELQELATSFNDMTARVRRMVEHEKAFSADASHQLRTPLTALRLRLEALEYTTQPEGQADLDAALRETERLGHIVDGLLALARATDGDTPVVDVDLAAIARERIEMWAPLADERAVQLRYRGPSGAPAVAMRGAIDQIVDNLLSNSLDVAPGGSTIDVVVTITLDRATIAVVDEGPGMGDAELAHAFDRFFTTGGTGLGLAIVRRLAEASRGEAYARRASYGDGDGAAVGLEVGVTLGRARGPRPGLAS